jgi:mRNA interferase MazF
VVVDFPGVIATKRRPAVVVSSPTYHSERPDLIVGLITSQLPSVQGATD